MLTFAIVIVWSMEKRRIVKHTDTNEQGIQIKQYNGINGSTKTPGFSQHLQVTSERPTTQPLTISHATKTKKMDAHQEDLCPSCVIRYNTVLSVEEEFFCMNMSIKPTASICLYRKEEDSVVSASILASGMWEKDKVEIYLNILKRNRDLSVLDIGANLGLYSLVAAALGRNVLAVEPVPSTLLRFHKAIKLGHFEKRITVLQNIVSDKHGTVSMAVSPSNKGGSRVSDCANPSMKCLQVKSIYLDDVGLFAHKELDMTKAFLKLDIEGSEHLAMSHANVLFELIHIPYVVTEWMNINFYCFIPYPPRHRYKLEQMIGFFAIRGYTPYHFAPRGKRLKAKGCSRWPKEVIWVHASVPYPLNGK